MTHDNSTEAAMQELIAKDAIRERLYRYCRGEDRMDGSLSSSTWHPDGTASYGRNGELFNGPAGDTYVAQIQKSLATYTGTSHQVSNILIELDGDRAVSEAYVTATIWRIGDDGAIWRRTTIGRYLDRWSCRDGVWAVDHRRFVFDVSFNATDAGGSESRDKAWERNAEWFEGRHGVSDPSYEHFASLAGNANP